MTAISGLKVYATHPHQCSYLEGEEATTLFVDPKAKLNLATYSRLSEMGFRRSGPHLYRPHCEMCQACIPARIPVYLFKPNRQQRRAWKKNSDLQVKKINNIEHESFYTLYKNYINIRHSDGDMCPPSREQYKSFLTCEWDATYYFGFYKGNQLLAVAVLDEMDNGLSSVYTFYDPSESNRSLGVYTILWQIKQAKTLNLPAVYLGYWVNSCQKMRYKIDYRPIELYIDGKWNLVC